MKTALIYHPIYLKHDTGPHHPERPSRLQSILRRLKKGPVLDKLGLVEPYQASMEEIMLVHSEDYALSVKEACSRAPVGLDPDTVVSKDSFEAALFAAGAAIKAVDLIAGGSFENAFCMVRPPGHHARPNRAMGFCLFNNIAIAARYIQKRYGLRRVLIVDWDVHHGNGTEEIFYRDQDVFYISLHQYPHYPGTGSADSTGEGEGKGLNLNIPMEVPAGDSEYINAFKELIIPAIDGFRPEFILISAGFDGHRDDALSSITLTEKGYYEMTMLLKERARLYSNSRIVSVLEGGYNLLSLANSVHSHLEALLYPTL